MVKWIRIIAPVVALTVVLGAGYAALGNGQASARQISSVVGSAAQPPTPVPTEEPKGGLDTDMVEQQDGPQSGAQDGETKDGTVDAETKDGANQPDNEAADAAALAGKATVTADQAKATALAANPGATVVKAELDDENGVLVYSVELSTGADVKIDAQKGNIVNTDQAGSDANDGAGDSEASDAPNK
jgi:uncharacterized membrane protein YkoI